MRSFSRLLLSLFFVGAGVAHFLSPRMYLQLMPSYLPWHLPLIFLSGAAEVAGGIGVLVPPLRTSAARGLVLLLLAVFPANLHAAWHGMEIAGSPVPAWLLWLRLPLQFVLIYWVYWSFLKNRDSGMELPEKNKAA